MLQLCLMYLPDSITCSLCHLRCPDRPQTTCQCHHLSSIRLIFNHESVTSLLIGCLRYVQMQISASEKPPLGPPSQNRALHPDSGMQWRCSNMRLRDYITRTRRHMLICHKIHNSARRRHRKLRVIGQVDAAGHEQPA